MNGEEEKPRDLKKRMRQYSLDIIEMYCALPQNDRVAQVLGRQVLNSGTSPGAHHREASRARSDAEFISKMEGGLQELEETDYWMDLLVGSGRVVQERMRGLIEETNELMAIFVSSVNTVKRRKKRKE
ncbi:MAG: four helix bundle protein [Kiritimatiellae bacterium]|nr:four helix bundle protein [Kiritimatiellia bacterium]